LDSLTQIVLGAGVGELIMGRKIGNKAILLGAIAGTVPDLDVIATSIIDDPIANLEIHRAYSHALFIHIFLAIPFAYLCYKLFKKKHSFMSFYWLWFLGFTTHALLDGFTTYGTQLFLPFSNFLFGLNNISVVDPLYTLPFMGLLIWAMFYKKEDPKRFKIACWSFYVSSAYMLLTFGFKYRAHTQFDAALQSQNIKYNYVSTTPTLFNSVLWSGMAASDSAIYLSEYSIFQGKKEIKFASYNRNLNEMMDFDCKELQTLKWFAQDKFFVLRPSEDSLLFFNVKWGRSNFTKTEPKESMIFYTLLTKSKNGIKVTMIEPNFKDTSLSDLLGMLWRRIWNN
jgi:inner membrane protein